MIYRKFIYRSFLLAAVILVSLGAYGQDLTKKISIDVRNEAISVILDQISKAGDIHFSYDPQQIPIDKKISIRCKNTPVSDILNEILVKNGITYQVIENQVVLQALKPRAAKGAEQGGPEKGKFTLNGYLKDKSSGEVLIGANVYVQGTTRGVQTNAYGFYSLTLPEGSYPIVYSFIGYKSQVKVLDFKSNLEVSTELEAMKFEIKAVEILANNQESDFRRNQLSDMKFSPRTLSQLPGFAGDVDIIKSLQSVPGIKAFGDGSALFYVRGGSSDQNLLLIDEAPIYNPSHLFGFFSALSPDAIKDVEAYKGDFPASLGGRLSSVIDVKTKDGNMKNYGLSGSIGPFTSSLTAEGPIIRDKSSFFISGRRSNLNWLKPSAITEKSFSINFFDLNAKFNLVVNNNNRLFLTLYGGYDNFSRLTTSDVNTYGISWSNLLGTLRWNHIFNRRLFSNTTAYFSQYNYYLYISQQQSDYWYSGIANMSVKTDYTFYLNPSNTIKAGIDLSSHFSNPGNVHYTDPQNQQFTPEVNKYRSLEYVIYISNEQEVTKRLSLRYGIRLSAWEDIGPADVFYYNTNHQVADTLHVGSNSYYALFFRPEPRLNLQYTLGQDAAIKASYTRTTQFLQQLSNSVSPFNSLEVWAPCNLNIKPQQADQVSLGYFRQLGKGIFNMSVESFYKAFYDQIDYKDHANMVYNPLIEGELRFGTAWSYGIEFLLRKTEGRFTGWLAYTWTRIFRKTPEVNDGASYPAFYDRPNDVSLNLAYDSEKHWAVSASWYYMTGSPITSPTGFYIYNGYTVPIYGSKNNDRLPAYHRLDLSFTYRLNKPGARFRQSLILAVYNAYGNRNVFSVNFNKIMNGNGDIVVPANQNGNNVLIPTSISVAGIIPSLNYTFRF